MQNAKNIFFVAFIQKKDQLARAGLFSVIRMRRVSFLQSRSFFLAAAFSYLKKPFEKLKRTLKRLKIYPKLNDALNISQISGY